MHHHHYPQPHPLSVGFVQTSRWVHSTLNSNVYRAHRYSQSSPSSSMSLPWCCGRACNTWRLARYTMAKYQPTMTAVGSIRGRIRILRDEHELERLVARRKDLQTRLRVLVDRHAPADQVSANADRHIRTRRQTHTHTPTDTYAHAGRHIRTRQQTHTHTPTDAYAHADTHAHAD